MKKNLIYLFYLSLFLIIIDINKLNALRPIPSPYDHSYLGFSTGINAITTKNDVYTSLKLFPQFDYSENLRSGFQVFLNYILGLSNDNPPWGMKTEIKLGYYSFINSYEQNINKLKGLTENLDTILFSASIKNNLNLSGCNISFQLFLRTDPFHRKSPFQIYFGFGPQLNLLTSSKIEGNIDINTDKKIISCLENSPFKYDNNGIIKNYRENVDNMRNLLFNLLFSMDFHLFVKNFLYNFDFTYGEHGEYKPIVPEEYLESYLIFNLIFNYGLGLTPLLKDSNWKIKTYSINFEVKFPLMWSKKYLFKDD